MSERRTLELDGELVRERLADDGKLPSGLADIRRIDLTAVERIDVAGIGYVAELIARVEKARGERPPVTGEPEGLGELAQAYRIKPDFSDFP